MNCNIPASLCYDCHWSVKRKFHLHQFIHDSRVICVVSCHHAAAQVNINVCVRLGKTATGTHKMLENVYRNESLFHSCVFKWFKVFREVQEPLRWYKESVVVNFLKSIVKKLHRLLARDGCIIPKLTNINQTLTRRQILCEDFGKRKFCINPLKTKRRLL